MIIFWGCSLNSAQWVCNESSLICKYSCLLFSWVKVSKGPGFILQKMHHVECLEHYRILLILYTGYLKVTLDITCLLRIFMVLEFFEMYSTQSLVDKCHFLWDLKSTLEFCRVSGSQLGMTIFRICFCKEFCSSSKTLQT